VRTRAAALAVLALTAAGCGSAEQKPRARLPVSGPPNVLRVAFADVLWPLEPERARTRDEIVLARMLFATPLRVGPDGRLRRGLCTTWRQAGAGWSLRCAHAPSIAQQLRRTRLLGSREVVARGSALSITPRGDDADLLYRLTEVSAAPAAVPGPFRLISASPRRVVLERDGLRVAVEKLEPFEALRRFRAGRLDEAPVPLGDLRAVQLDPQLAPALRLRRILAADAVVFERPLPAELVRAYDATADRADYQALVTEFAAPPAEDLRDRGQPSAGKAAVALREARRRIPSLPRIAVRFALPRDPTLAYGTNLLVAAWRDLGLGAVVGGEDARLERLAAPYPRPRALLELARGRLVVPIAWVADARLVSPRVQGWHEDELGAVDYSRVRLRAPSRRR
jgi:hypothetical protein